MVLLFTCFYFNYFDVKNQWGVWTNEWPLLLLAKTQSRRQQHPYFFTFTHLAKYLLDAWQLGFFFKGNEVAGVAWA